MEVDGHFHAPTALSPENEQPVPTTAHPQTEKVSLNKS
jgi:hypothetical protein